MSDNHLANLQDESDAEEDLPDFYEESCPLSSQDEYQVMTMKGEEVSDMQEEAVCVPIPWHAVKAECEVSCISVSC